mgnify:CR=1 FL=1
MGPTYHLTHTPTVRLVVNEMRHDDRADEALDERLEGLLNALDEIHEAASAGALAQTGLSKAELLGLLNDLIYTAQQTVAEIQSQGADLTGTPTLRLVRKTS